MRNLAPVCSDRNLNGASGALLIEADILKMVLLLQLKTSGSSCAQFNSQVWLQKVVSNIFVWCKLLSADYKFFLPLLIVCLPCFKKNNSVG